MKLRTRLKPTVCTSNPYGYCTVGLLSPGTTQTSAVALQRQLPTFGGPKSPKRLLIEESQALTAYGRQSLRSSLSCWADFVLFVGERCD